jgi:glutathione S-transferase
MKLFWSPRSPFVRKVMIVLHETGQVDQVVLERNVVAMSVPNDTVMKTNPLNKIPTLVLADGRALFDSRVICEFLDGRHDGPPMFPSGRDAYFRALTWQALGDGLLDVLLIWRNWYQDRGLTFDDGADPYLSAFARKVHTTLDALEAAAPELDAAPFSIGHVAIGCALGHLDFRWPDIEWRPRRPALTSWYSELSQRGSFAATGPVDDPVDSASGSAR